MSTKFYRTSLPALLSIAAIGLVTIGGIHLTGLSKAATTNPYGFADYCALEGNTLAIYGWAADPQATSLPQPSVTVVVGGVSQTVATDRSGYRTAAINTWIDNHRAGDPKPGTYGFKAVYTGFYKGSRPAVTGAAINVGAGANAAIAINNATVDGDTTKTPFAAGDVVPDSCMPARPSPPPTPAPTPAPAPAPAPGPAPAPTPAPRPAPTPARPGPAPAPTPTPQAPSLSSDADAAIAAGTLAAQLTVPAGNATKVHLNYGTNPLVLDQHTDDQIFTGADTAILLGNLKPATGYSYQIVRSTDDGRTTTSPVRAFATTGFTTNIHYVNSKSQGVKGIPGKIKELKRTATSGGDGILQFRDIAPGTYTLSYTYQHKTYQQKISLDAAGVNSDAARLPEPAVAHYFINVDKLAALPSAAESGGFPWKWLISGLIGLVLVALLIIGARRRAAGGSAPYDEYPYQDYQEPAATISPTAAGAAASPVQADSLAPPPPPPIPAAAAPAEPPAVVPPTLGTPPSGQATPPPPPAPLGPIIPDDSPPHMGESLKTMVLRSMAEAQKRQKDSVQPPADSQPQDDADWPLTKR